MPAKAKPRYQVVREDWEYPGDPAIVQRLLKGEHVPYDQRKMKDGPALGKIITDGDLPDEIIASGLANGILEPLEDEDERQTRPEILAAAHVEVAVTDAVGRTVRKPPAADAHLLAKEDEEAS